MADAEKERLAREGDLSPNIRLSCQIRVESDVEVRVINRSQQAGIPPGPRPRTEPDEWASRHSRGGSSRPNGTDRCAASRPMPGTEASDHLCFCFSEHFLQRAARRRTWAPHHEQRWNLA